MSVSETLTNLMNAGRRVYGGTGKMSIADLTTTMLKPNSTSVVQDSNSATITSQGLSLSHSDGATLITASTQGADKRLMFPVGENATPTDQMAFVMIARKSSKASTDTISFRVGGYDATTNFTVSSTDWQFYRVPLNDSASPYVSLYSDQGGPLIEYKYFALTKVGGVINPNLLADPFKFTNGWSDARTQQSSGGVKELVFSNKSSLRSNCDTITGADLASTYTWTFYASADNPGDKLHTELWGGGGKSDIPLTYEWKKYTVRGKLASSNCFWLFFWGLDSNKGNIYVKLPYLYKE